MAKITLWQMRDKKGIKLIALSKVTGVSVSELSKIENNKVSPTLNTLEKIAIGLKCNITDLFESDHK